MIMTLVAEVALFGIFLILYKSTRLRDSIIDNLVGIALASIVYAQITFDDSTITTVVQIAMVCVIVILVLDTLLDLWWYRRLHALGILHPAKEHIPLLRVPSSPAGLE